MMLPSPTLSIAAQGEWSLGQILDIYCHFAEPADHYYLGRWCLAGLDPNSPDFACLSRYFTVGKNSMEQHPQIREVIELMYGPVLNKWGGRPQKIPIQLLLSSARSCFLPSVVYHSEFWKEMIGRVATRSSFFRDSVVAEQSNPACFET
jgi:hypothetical protein